MRKTKDQTINELRTKLSAAELELAALRRGAVARQYRGFVLRVDGTHSKPFSDFKAAGNAARQLKAKYPASSFVVTANEVTQ